VCTSYRAMEAFRGELTRLLGRKPMMQGDGPKQNLLARFRSHGHGVLVATMSFWRASTCLGRIATGDSGQDTVCSANRSGGGRSVRGPSAAGENPFVRYQVRWLRSRSNKDLVGWCERSKTGASWPFWTRGLCGAPMARLCAKAFRRPAGRVAQRGSRVLERQLRMQGLRID